MDPRTTRLLEGPIGATLLRLAIPNTIVMVVQASIGLIETYFISKLGTDALAGMAVVFPIVMLIQMISAGAMGGGIMSAVSRTLGAGKRDDANVLVWHAAAIAVALGLITTILALTIGRPLYALMGGQNGSLAAALAYSNLVFLFAIPLWLFNSLAAVIRGTGNILFPASVTAIGAVFLIPLSPMLIFGWGDLPQLGIVGGAAAIAAYYVIGSIIFAAYLWSGRGVLKPSVKPARIAWAPTREILRVGFISSLVSVTTNIAIATATGLTGIYGPAAVAGYGVGARLEYLLVPLVFGLGAPIGAMVGTAIGAQQRKRALRVAWTGAVLAGLLSEAVGLAAAFFPHAWIALFSDDPLTEAIGTHYLHIVGPFYGFFGFGLALYFASQGAGSLRWPLIAAGIRVTVAAIGGWAAIHFFGNRFLGGIDNVFAMLALALVISGVMNAVAVAMGVWFTGAKRAPAITGLTQPAGTRPC